MEGDSEQDKPRISRRALLKGAVAAAAGAVVGEILTEKQKKEQEEVVYKIPQKQDPNNPHTQGLTGDTVWKIDPTGVNDRIVNREGQRTNLQGTPIAESSTPAPSQKGK